MEWACRNDDHFLPNPLHREFQYASEMNFGSGDMYAYNVNIECIPNVLVQLRRLLYPYTLTFFIEEFNGIKVQKIVDGQGTEPQTEVTGGDTTCLCVFGASVDLEFTENESYSVHMEEGDIVVITGEARNLHHYVRMGYHTGISYVCTFRIW